MPNSLFLVRPYVTTNQMTVRNTEVFIGTVARASDVACDRTPSGRIDHSRQQENSLCYETYRFIKLIKGHWFNSCLYHGAQSFLRS